MLETPKKTILDHKTINIENYNKHKNEIKKYCLNDSIILFELVKKYDNIIKIFFPDWLKNIHSISSLSLNLFNEFFNPTNTKIISSIDFDNFHRQGYFGGRCEVFGNPKIWEKIYHFDFTGMYAQVMEEEYCYGNWKIIKDPKEIINDGFYYIDAYSLTFIPILPHHSEEKKLVFTNGFISGLYWYEEIKLFLNYGGIINKIHYKISFEKKDKIFKNFINTFTEIRKKNKESNTIGKLIINSLYGRLGMEEKKTETRILNEEDYTFFRKKNEKSIIKENTINNFHIVEYHKKRKNDYLNSNVALASSITSKARIKLFKGIMDVINNGGRILYTDTDSIFAAFKKNVDNSKFGDVSFDISKKDTKISEALFALPKAYILRYPNNTVSCKIKGISNNSLNFNEFKSLFYNDKEKKINLTVLKKANFIIKQENMYKIINLGNYEKRIFTKNKTETLPLFKTKEKKYIQHTVISENSFINDEIDFKEKLIKRNILKKNENILITYQSIIEDPSTDEKTINGLDITIHDNSITLLIDNSVMLKSIEIILYAFKNNIKFENYDFGSRLKILNFLLNKNALILDITLEGPDCKKKFNNINIVTSIISTDVFSNKIITNA